MNLIPSPSQGGGDCLFDSVKTALASIGVTTTVLQLRKVVAISILDPANKKANETLLQWATFYADAIRCGDNDISQEYAHMAVLFPTRQTVVHFPLSHDQRVKVAKEIMKSSFYGEQYSLMVLQRALRISIVVVDLDGQPVFQEEQRREKNGIMFIQLTQLHFQPLHDTGKYVWKWRQLSRDIRKTLRPHLSKKCRN